MKLVPIRNPTLLIRLIGRALLLITGWYIDTVIPELLSESSVSANSDDVPDTFVGDDGNDDDDDNDDDYDGLWADEQCAVDK